MFRFTLYKPLASVVFLFSLFSGSLLLDLSLCLSDDCWLLPGPFRSLSESLYAICLQLWCLPPLASALIGLPSGNSTGK